MKSKEVKRFKRTIKGRQVDLSPMQQKAISREGWSLDEGRDQLGRHAKLVLGGLVKQGLMYAQGLTRWRRTALGAEVVKVMNGK